MITMSLPPPRRNDLYDLERHVGWITPDIIGFSGFADRAEAASAAWTAHVALANLQARRTGSPFAAPNVRTLAVLGDGDAERIVADDQTIATLTTPASLHAIADGWFGFEIVIPSPGDDLAARSAAHVIYHALRRSGVSWAARTDAAPMPPRRPTVFRPLWRQRDPIGSEPTRHANRVFATAEVR